MTDTVSDKELDDLFGKVDEVVDDSKKNQAMNKWAEAGAKVKGTPVDPDNVVQENKSGKSYGIDDFPTDLDFQAPTEKPDFAPLPEDTYQAVIKKIEIRDNFYYKSDPEKNSKYQLNYKLEILDDGQKGRLVWDTTGFYMAPEIQKGGPSKLYKIVSKVMDMDFSWDDCHSFAPDAKTLYKNLLENVQGHQVMITTENYKNKKGNLKTKIVSYRHPKAEL